MGDESSSGKEGTGIDEVIRLWVRYDTLHEERDFINMSGYSCDSRVGGDSDSTEEMRRTRILMFSIGATEVIIPTKEGDLLYRKTKDQMGLSPHGETTRFRRNLEYVLVGRV